MSTKLLRIFAFIPILDLFVIAYCFFKRLSNNRGAQAIVKLLIWIGIMVAFAIVRAIVTVVFSAMEMFTVIGIVTYVTLYISITAGALIHCSGMQKA